MLSQLVKRLFGFPAKLTTLAPNMFQPGSQTFYLYCLRLLAEPYSIMENRTIKIRMVRIKAALALEMIDSSDKV